LPETPAWSGSGVGRPSRRCQGGVAGLRQRVGGKGTIQRGRLRQGTTPPADRQASQRETSTGDTAVLYFLAWGLVNDP